jgi:hypothetical protein
LRKRMKIDGVSGGPTTQALIQGRSLRLRWFGLPVLSRFVLHFTFAHASISAGFDSFVKVIHAPAIIDKTSKCLIRHWPDLTVV